MNKIEVVVLQEPTASPVAMTGMLAKLTQKGHKVNSGADLLELYSNSLNSFDLVDKILKMSRHKSIVRHTPITIGIVGASRRFLAQARTHHVGIDWVSASLQYSDYSGLAQFVVPYEVLTSNELIQAAYLQKCEQDLNDYEAFVEEVGNDAAGYVMNQALRNVLVATANHEAWLNFIATRTCKRNTTETAYVASLIWEALWNTRDGATMFRYSGPDCLWGGCSEGKMSCGEAISLSHKSNPATEYIKQMWPLLERGR